MSQKDDLISRRDAIDAMANTLWHYPNDCYKNLNVYEFAKGVAELGLRSLPSAQPDLKGAKCKIICSQRQTGRTTKLIEKCARYKYALIVCPTRMRAISIFHDARKMGKDIPVPITFEDFIRGLFDNEHINAFLIDDLDQCLEIYARNVPIDTVVFERRAEPATSPLLTEKWKRQHMRGEQE